MLSYCILHSVRCILIKKNEFCHYLLTLNLFQTYMNFFILLSTKEDTLKKQLMEPNYFIFNFLFNTMEVNGHHQETHTGLEQLEDE